MGPKTFQKIIDHVYLTRDRYSNAGGDEQWDFPDYRGLSKNISNQLSSEAVDAIQDVIQRTWIRKRDFARAYKNCLRDLGEPGWWKCKIK